MDSQQPEWLRAGLAERGERGPRRRGRRPPRRSRRGLLSGLALGAGALAGGALLLPQGRAAVDRATGALASLPALPLDPAGLAPGAPAATPTPARPALAAPLTYAAVGASDAVGVGANDPSREGWVSLVAQGLPGGTRLLNLGVPGILLRDALEGVLPRAVRANPGLVTIWLVVNDVLARVPLESYRADLDRFLGGLRAGTSAQIAIGNLPDPPGTLGGVQLPAFVRRTIIGQWNGAIAEVARAHNAILVDLFARWPVGEHPEFIGPDGLHPTAAGYRSLAGVFLDTLRGERLLS